MTGFSPQERLARIRLARTDGIGAVGFGQLLARHGSGGAACEALAMAGKPLAPPQVAEAEMDRVAKLGGRHLLPGEDDYPPLLAALSDPPPLLIALGDTGLAARPVVAMVGARHHMLRRGPPRPVILVMVGTAVTVEALDQHGRFLGGLILPGQFLIVWCME